jgi:hypothetical protein
MLEILIQKFSLGIVPVEKTNRELTKYEIYLVNNSAKIFRKLL